MALQLGTEGNILPRHQPPSPMDGLGSRHTHGEMGHRQGKEGVSIVGKMGRKTADGAAWMALQLGMEEIFCRATNLRVQWMGWGAGRPMGRWAAIAGRKDSQLSEEWRIEQRMGPLDGQAIKHGNIEQPSTYNYSSWIGEQATHWVRSWR